MIAASAGVKVMVATKPVDFRNGADGRPEIVFPARLFLQTETGEWEQAAALHYEMCPFQGQNDKRLAYRERFEFRSDKPKLQTGPVQFALIISICRLRCASKEIILAESASV